MRLLLALKMWTWGNDLELWDAAMVDGMERFVLRTLLRRVASLINLATGISCEIRRLFTIYLNGDQLRQTTFTTTRESNAREVGLARGLEVDDLTDMMSL